MKSEDTIFKFTSYKFEPGERKILFHYKTEFKNKKPLFFTEKVILPKKPDIKSVSQKLIKKLMASLHIVLGVSYFKLYCATKMELPYHFSKEEADFWNTLYQKGLGEFFYKNNLNPDILPSFPHKKTPLVSYCLKKNERCLVGIGGGKDSIVTAELLKGSGFDITGFNVQTGRKTELIDRVVEKIGIKNLIIKRILDPKIYQRHQYDGHIPISAVYAFLGVLAAVLYGYSYVIVGNEYSSNFGNVKYRGRVVNHQWSKSFEFERSFQNYIKTAVSSGIFYFSLLRPFYELRIAELFSKYKKYFPYFSSCNRNFSLTSRVKRGLWCGQCPKCLFTFIILSSFLTKKNLIDIFGKNLYQEKKLLPLFKDILGLGRMKPFDCVGTFKEAKTAFLAASRKFDSDIFGQLLPKIRLKKDEIKRSFKANKENNIPEQFKFLGMKNVLVLGYGKEGRVTKKYLKKYYPSMKIGIADVGYSKDYLKKQKDFDIAVKTPGLKKELVQIPYTTATNIFFSKVKGKNTIIGVTGSKGKSTTSSLIFAILKAAGKDVELLGNIGRPMLGRLMSPVPGDKIFVLELSSYQLDDLKFSPDIAVVTSLFPEHIDYHHGLKKYYQAKKNIINFQNEDSYFTYDPKNKETVSWLGNYKGRAVPFSNNIPLKNKEILLMGEHNKNNVKAAVAVAKILNIENKVIRKAVKNFKGLPHRLEFVGEFRGIKFYDDAISTTPESTIMAIKSLENIGTILLGGQDRGYNFSELEKTVKKYKIKNIVLFPESGIRIFKSTKSFKVLKTKSMEKAVEFAYKNTKDGGICLLSCASPSYSLWKNFEDKGNQFKKYVKKLGEI